MLQRETPKSNNTPMARKHLPSNTVTSSKALSYSNSFPSTSSTYSPSNTSESVTEETPKSNTLTARKFLPIHIFPSSKILSYSNSFPSISIPSSPSLTFSESMMEENIDSAEHIIMKWDLNSSSVTQVTSLFTHNRKEAKEFLKSVKELRRAMHFLVSHHPNSHKLVLAQNLMQIAMKRLKKEFYQILSANRDKLHPESVSSQSSDGSSNFEDEDDIGLEEEIMKVGESISKVEKITAVAMADLKSIADCMISIGYGSECITIYKLVRKSVVDEGLFLLGKERFRSSQIQKFDWEVLEHKIWDWMHGANIAVKTLFAGEKVLCDHVFSASQAIRESCFSDITKEGATNLFKFPELIAKCKKLPEKIFPMMKLHEALSGLRPEIESIFSSEPTASVRIQSLTSLTRIGDTIRAILSDFESSIRKDSSRTPVSGGGIHPLTQTTMDYISSLGDYSKILSEIVGESPPTRHMPLPESYFGSPFSDDDATQPVSRYLAWLILVLLCKLDNKAELYKDVSLSYLFLVNNLQFIVEKVRSTSLGIILGWDWIHTHFKKVKQYASKFEVMAWHKVFSSLPQMIAPEMSPEVAKESLQRFNAAFEEAQRKQVSWVVTNQKLRDDLKVSIAKKLVPTYRELYKTCSVVFRGQTKFKLLVKFGPDDLSNHLSDLFRGVSYSGSSSASSRGCILR